MNKKIPKIIGVSFLVAATVSAGLIYYQNSHPSELGVEDGHFKPLNSKPNNISSQAINPQKRVEALEFKATIEETLEALKKSANTIGKATLQVEENDYLHIVFTSPLMRFHDDTEFWLDRDKRF